MTCSDPRNVCPLCRAGHATLFHADPVREYLICVECHLIFVPQEFHLTPAHEKAEYDLHENVPTDLRYRRFLERIFKPVNERVATGSSGLDFGSGPGPTLSIMFKEAGHRMAIFDQFYAPDASVLEVQYDFVTASETVEHFRQPRKDLEKIWACVRPGGLLGIMTKLTLNAQAFAQWHYKNDRTHVCFFSKSTFGWLARRWNSNAQFVDQDVVLFEKTNT